MSRNESHQLPLHFAVRMNRPDMVALLVELGADPLAVDGSGHSVAVNATAPDIDRRVMEKIRALLSGELTSADRGHRRPRGSALDLVALLSLGETATAEQMLRDKPD